MKSNDASYIAKNAKATAAAIRLNVALDLEAAPVNLGVAVVVLLLEVVVAATVAIVVAAVAAVADAVTAAGAVP